MKPLARRRRIEGLVSSAQGDAPVIASLMLAILDNIDGIIKGDLQPLEVLTLNEGLKSLYTLFSPPRTWRKFLSLLVHSNPRLRILELGGGTGGTTAMMLDPLRSEDGLPMYLAYTFSDISPSALSAAKERFKEDRSVLYTALDISKDPVQQGFVEADYDVIIASNVSLSPPLYGLSLTIS